VVCFPGHDHGKPAALGQPHRVPATDARRDLRQTMLGVINHARAVLGNHVSIRVRVDFAALELAHVMRQELHPVRVHAAQTRRHQRVSHQLRSLGRNARCHQNPLNECFQILGPNHDCGQRFSDLHRFSIAFNCGTSSR
jgi:hypothetical protein